LNENKGGFLMKINGQIVKVEIEVSLLTYLLQNKYDISKIAVELNGEIISKADYTNILLQEDDTLEVVSFVGGG
jgi:thiamine biosynthesis protein ThiS